jgi:hypothetical protein
MSVLIFRLNGVGEDEADEVRQLLDSHGLDCYETSAGRWGVSVAGLWLQDESQAQRAKALLDEYSRARQLQVRSDYRQARERGEAPNWWQRAVHSPLRYLAIALLGALILYLSTWPFITLGG